MMLPSLRLDKVALGKAIGVCALSWLAVPIIYYMIVKKKKVGEEENDGISGKGREDNVCE